MAAVPRAANILALAKQFRGRVCFMVYVTSIQNKAGTQKRKKTLCLNTYTPTNVPKNKLIHYPTTTSHQTERTLKRFLRSTYVRIGAHSVLMQTKEKSK